MNNMKTISIGFIFCMAVIGCRFWVNKKYQLNRPGTFANKAAYIQAIEQEKIIPIGQLLYVESRSLPLFYHEVIKKSNAIVYLGTYVNDTLCLKKSTQLQENESCWGRIEKEINEQVSIFNPPDNVCCRTESLSAYPLRYIENDELFHPNAIGKWTIYLLYSYSLGSYYNRLYQSVFGLQKKYANKLNVYIISLDPVNTNHTKR